MCTNRSAPPASGVMKPKPFSPSYLATTPSPARAGGPSAAGGRLPAEARAGAAVPGAVAAAGSAGCTSATLRACGPLSPAATSKMTRSPSVSQVRPSASARMCTNRSSPPPSGVMKPKALSSSYQGTVPSAPSAEGAGAAVGAASAPSGMTFSACGPRSPSPMRKATRWPSDRTPPVRIAELCTKSSAPAAVGAGEAVALGRLVPGHRPEEADRRTGRRTAGDAHPLGLPTAEVALAQLVVDGLALAQQPGAAVADDLGGVHEQVVAAVAGSEEAEAPFGVEPADGPLQHGDISR